MAARDHAFNDHRGIFMRLRSTVSAALILSALSLPSYADHQNGKWAIGTWVIDRTHNIGQVVDYPKPGKVRYQVGSYTLESTVDGLHAEVAVYNGISPRVKVIDANNNVGTSLRVFEDGRVQYQAGNYTLVSSKIEPEVAEVRSIRAGTIVIDAQNNVGTALAVFRGGRGQYRSGSYTLISRDLAPQIAALGLIRADAIVMDERNNIGKVLRVFKDGRVQYRSGSYDLISKALSAEVDVHDGIRSGNTVIDSQNNIGTVLHAFEDGRFNYRSGSYSLVSRKLSPKVEELDGFRAGLIVIDERNNVGLIELVFRDGRKSYRAGSYRLVSKNLSGEVDAHRLYRKGVAYATPNFSVGTPIHFFENGKIQFNTLSGYQLIATTLFEEVSFVGDGYRAGSQILDNRLREGVIVQVFANGTVAYRTKENSRQGDDDKLFEARVYEFVAEHDADRSESLRAQELREWVAGVAEHVAATLETPGRHFPPSNASVAHPEAFTRIKAALLKHLDSHHPGLIPDEDLLRKVREFLTR